MKPSWLMDMYFFIFRYSSITNAAVLLHCTEYSFNLVASTIITRIVLQWNTGTNIFKKLMPSFWQLPWAQNLALNFFTEPSGYLLILKAHVHGSTFISGVRCTNSQQSKPFVRVLSSVLMACQNSAWKEPLVAVSHGSMMDCLCYVWISKFVQQVGMGQ